MKRNQRHDAHQPCDCTRTRRWTLYQAAEIHAILNNRRDAVDYMRRAVANGWLGINYVDYQLDPNGSGLLTNLRDDVEFQQVRADLRNMVDALAAKY